MSFFKDLMRNGHQNRQGDGRGGHHGGGLPYRDQSQPTAPALSCPSCAAANLAGSRFCGQCGTGLGARICGACSAERPASAKFCPNCGTAA
ncbi:MAG: zinc ribbon domain-containing protein [Rhizobiales bacterium]|nr:zinc ribbon domain-containing protein [Hyphomicrobiales bacterium]